MAEITTRPARLPSGNELDRFDAADNIPAEIRMGNKTLVVLANPPHRGGTVTLMVKLQVVDDCVHLTTEGEDVHFKRCRLVGAWLPGQPEPVDANQGTLWDQAPPVGSIRDDEQPGDDDRM